MLLSNLIQMLEEELEIHGDRPTTFNVDTDKGMEIMSIDLDPRRDLLEIELGYNDEEG